MNSGWNLKSAPNSSSSGMNSTSVPLRSAVFATRWSFFNFPRENSTILVCPSRTACAR